MSTPAASRGKVWRRRLLRAAAVSLALGAGLAGLLLLVTRDRVRLFAPAPTVQLVDRMGRFLGERSVDDRLGFWPVDPLPPRVVAATLAAEDDDYFQHGGVDLRAVARASWQNLRAGRRVSGASTIAMQVARMQDPGRRSWRNKLLESVTAERLIQVFGHRAVLAHYLRVAPYGNNIHGIGYAARRYFDKPVRDLSWAETTFLAALPQGPGLMNPYRVTGRARAVQRARHILDRLASAGQIDPLARAQADAELGRLVPPPAPVRPDATLHLVFAPELTPAGDAAEPRLVTSIDLDRQTETQALLARHVERLRPRGELNAAAVVVELPSGRVRAAVGSTNWHDAAHDGAVDYTRTRRGAGSTLKPFLYATALDRGVIAPNLPLDDLPRPGDDVANADHRFLGPMLPGAALANSRNVPAVDLIERLGVPAFDSTLRDLDLYGDATLAERYGTGLALGAAPVRPLDMARAYLALAGDGRARPLRWLEDDAEPPPGRRVFTEGTARRVARWLSDPMLRLPSFPRGGHGDLPFPVAMKTGTTRNYRDAWTVAWTERWLVVVWMGQPSGQPTRGVSGYRGAAAVAHDLIASLDSAHKDGLDDGRLPPPAGARPYRLCAHSGARATEACEHTTTLWLDQAPTEACLWHRRVAVDRRTGRPATDATPASARETRTFHALPARYHAWMRSVGLDASPDQPMVADAEAVQRTPRVRVVAPRADDHVLTDPEASDDSATLRLAAVVDPPVPQLVWFVDGEPFAVVDHPYVTRWPIVPGEHTFEARLPFAVAGSLPVRVLAR